MVRVSWGGEVVISKFSQGGVSGDDHQNPSPTTSFISPNTPTPSITPTITISPTCSPPSTASAHSSSFLNTSGSHLESDTSSLRDKVDCAAIVHDIKDEIILLKHKSNDIFPQIIPLKGKYHPTDIKEEKIEPKNIELNIVDSQSISSTYTSSSESLIEVLATPDPSINRHILKRDAVSLKEMKFPSTRREAPFRRRSTQIHEDTSVRSKSLNDFILSSSATESDEEFEEQRKELLYDVSVIGFFFIWFATFLMLHILSKLIFGP